LKQGRQQFFFEKKNQKTFISCAPKRMVPPVTSKSFLVLFFKKELLPSFLSPASSAFVTCARYIAMPVR